MILFTAIRRLFAPVPVRVLASAVAFPAVNVGLNTLIISTPIPLFLDSMFTAPAAVLGLPYGLATAVLTNLFEEMAHGFSGKNLPFAACGVATVLIVWKMARTGNLRTPAHFMLCTFLVALANSLLGAALAVFVYGGGTGANIDVMVAGFSLAVKGVFSAAFLARVVANLLDKAPAVAAAMFLYRALHYNASPTPDEGGEAPLTGR
jgi:energy-coupling factor transport system substrate-specific component